MIPRWTPKRPKPSPRQPQEGPISLLFMSICVQVCHMLDIWGFVLVPLGEPFGLQDRVKMVQKQNQNYVVAVYHCLTAPRHPKTTPRARKTIPRPPQDVPRSPTEASRRPQKAFKRLPQGSQEARRGSHRRPRPFQNRVGISRICCINFWYS